MLNSTRISSRDFVQLSPHYLIVFEVKVDELSPNAISVSSSARDRIQMQTVKSKQI